MFVMCGIHSTCITCTKHCVHLPYYLCVPNTVLEPEKHSLATSRINKRQDWLTLCLIDMSINNRSVPHISLNLHQIFTNNTEKQSKIKNKV